MGIYDNASNLTKILNSINNLHKTDVNLLEKALIERTVNNISSEDVTYIGDYAFNNCTNLTSISFPNCTTVGTSAFADCVSLTTVSFPKCTTIGNYAFSGCTSLTTIYLMGSSVCALANSSAFSNTSIISYSGSIFVPSSLVTSYKQATNWTYFSNIIYGKG